MFDEDENSEKTPSRPKAFSLLRCENIGDRIREIPLTKSKKHIMMRRMRRARKDSVPPEGFITPHGSRQILAQHFYTPCTDMPQWAVWIVYNVSSLWGEQLHAWYWHAVWVVRVVYGVYIHYVYQSMSYVTIVVSTFHLPCTNMMSSMFQGRTGWKYQDIFILHPLHLDSVWWVVYRV